MKKESETKRYVWEKPDRKMTMEELWSRFEYDPEYEDEDPAYERAIWDRYGNPTYGTLCAKYESEHGLMAGSFTTMEEFRNFLDEVRAEADAEMEIENETYRLQHPVQA